MVQLHEEPMHEIVEPLPKIHFIVVSKEDIWDESSRCWVANLEIQYRLVLVGI